MDAQAALERLLSPAGRSNPYPIYEQLRSAGPVAQAFDHFYVVTGYEMIDGLLRDPRMRVTDDEQLSTQGPSYEAGPAARAIGQSMLETNGPDHTRMRRLAASAFTARRVAALRDTVAEQAGALADGLARTGEPVDFMAEFAYPLPVGVICALLGVPPDDQPWFRRQASGLTIILEPQLRWERTDEADAAAVALTGYFEELVGRRRAEPRDDLTTALVQAHDADGARLSRDELLANLILLLVAGFETTTNLLGNGLAALLAAPAQTDQLRADPSLAPRFVEEMLRYDSPVQLTGRWSREHLSVGGVTIEPYAQLLILLGAGNRDPSIFDNADVFDPWREGRAPLSFGAGAHYCLGAALARLEAQVAFPLLVQRFPDLRLVGRGGHRDRLTLRGYATLPVAVT